jgi:hypothetical protein
VISTAALAADREAAAQHDVGLPAELAGAHFGRLPAVVPLAQSPSTSTISWITRTPASGGCATTCRPRSSLNSSTRSRLPPTISASGITL